MSYTTKPEPSLEQLTNVSITDVSNDEVLKYNSTTGLWENGTAGGGGGGGNPYFFKGVILDNQLIRRSGGFGTIGLSPSGFRAPYNTNDGDLAGNIWTCPSDGVYRIILRLVVRVLNEDNMREAQIGLLDDPTFLQSGANPDFTKFIRYEQFVLTGINNGTQDAFLSWTWVLNDLVELVAGQTIQVIARIYTINITNPKTGDWTGGLARTGTAGNADGYGGMGHLTIEKVA